MKLSKYFETSSRIQAQQAGKKSVGASCNVFEIQDSIDSIAEAQAWSTHVLAQQGAPSLYLGNIRTNGASISTGGSASGPTSFGLIFDQIFSSMRRTEKKNGAGLLSMPWNYPDLDELKRFLDAPFKAAYRAIYLPAPNTPEANDFLNDNERVLLLASAYNDFKCFLVKKPESGLFINLCTEVELPHRGTCVLGAINLSQFTRTNFHSLFPKVMQAASKCMLRHMKQSNKAIKGTFLDCSDPRNKQFGLGLFGLASFLGQNSISYEQLAIALWRVLDLADTELYGSVEQNTLTIDKIVDAASFCCSQYKGFEWEFVLSLVLGYKAATQEIQGKAIKAFCFQPTVSTAHRCFDRKGFVSSPELQPVIGARTPEGVKTILKSAVKGDRIVAYHPKTWTVYDVDYKDYAYVSAAFQKIIDSTGLAHRHSHCFYGEQFESFQLKSWYLNSRFKHIKSLYYRLNLPNAESLLKDELWQTTEGIEPEGFSWTDLAQQPGQISCACEG
jgi:hypothetical protein